MEVFHILIKVENLNFRYALSDYDCLSGIDLEVSDGEFILIFGASGCGKTTLLRHMKRELVPAGDVSGQVLYCGQNISDVPAKRSAREIGYVMQNPDSQIVTDVVWHELAFGLENLGADTNTIRRRVAEMASFFGIGSWFHKKTAELSGGQKQILNLASILAMQPRLLLLDEPTSQLDPIAAREFIDIVSRLNRELGITVIMSEHRLEEVMPLSSRVLLMESGRIKYDTTPQRLVSLLTENSDERYLSSLPAASRIFSKVSVMMGAQMNDCPLTVREGKRRLCELFKDKGVQPLPNNNFKVSKYKPASGKNALIECRDIFFKYHKDAPDVFTGLTMSANSGELFCLLGENGSGKSTLLQIFAGVLRPQRGTVKIDGRNIRFLSQKELYVGGVGLLPQNPKAVFLHDTLRADLGDEGTEIAKMLGIEKLLDRHPYDLSGGEQQKAALARVLLQKPRILLLDEPTKGLDAQAKRELAELLLNLCKSGVLIIVSTHDIDFAAEYADKCALLFDGSIVSKESAREFFGGNCFYTTAANRIARSFDPGAITCEDVVKLCGE